MSSSQSLQAIGNTAGRTICNTIGSTVTPTLLWTLQMGEFYETMSTDAVLLVRNAGLKPMGQGGPPQGWLPHCQPEAFHH